ncbi:MAG: putative sulfate exporter family transporter [Planctomycetes bacterium]|nr:putative sulfate exporter family transporter [Planctomycetota bacterium]
MHSPYGTDASVAIPPTRQVHEDWLIVGIGAIALMVATMFVSMKPSNDIGKKPEITNHAKSTLAKLESWKDAPGKAFYSKPKIGEPQFLGGALLITFAVIGTLLIPIAYARGISPGSFLAGYSVLFVLAILAFLMSTQEVVKQYNFEYVLWALLLGLTISNTVGTPNFLKPMVIGDTFIKLGLVLFGAEVLFGKLIALGAPGIFTSWVVTPIVLITTYWFGQRVLKIESPSLNMVISADMSVCGVSAAIATGAACRAKREEVSYAIGVSLLFTAVMMIVQPYIVLKTGMDPIVGAAWIGGTIDSTGAVAAAGAVLGDDAATVANTVKMIQNVLIGVIAFGVATYWSTRDRESGDSNKVGISEIWTRFPKFVIGFIGASLAFSFLPSLLGWDSKFAEVVSKEITSQVRIWLFCLAFVAFGLETNFRELWKYLCVGKPLFLYIVGQAWSMILSLAMATLMFGVLYADKVKSILSK